MILGMIHLITHYETTLGAIEGQVLDDNKNTNITKEEDEFVNLFHIVRYLFMTFKICAFSDTLIPCFQDCVNLKKSTKNLRGIFYQMDHIW